MKKFLPYALCAIAILFVSCEKVNKPITPEEGIIIKAYVAEGEITRSSYANESTFSWVGNEVASFQLDPVGSGNHGRWLFYNTTTAGGSSGNFRSSGSSFPSGSWSVGDYAIYPSKGNSNCPSPYDSWDVGNNLINQSSGNAVELNNYYKTSVSNEMQYIPMIGYKDANGDFAFHTAMGILKITVSDIDDRLTSVQLFSSGQKLNGTFSLTGSGSDSYVAMANTSTASEQVLNVQYTDRADQTSLPFYFPVPVGTLNSGFQIKLLSGDNILHTAVAPQDVTIERNKISEITVAIHLPTKTPPTATVTGDYNARQANFTHNDAPKIKYGLTTSSTATLSTLTTSFTEEDKVSLTPTSTGTWYLVYQGYEEDEATTIGGENRVKFIYVSSNVSDVAGDYKINNNDNWKFTIAAAAEPITDGKNIMITKYDSNINTYDSTGECYGVLDPAAGTITIPSAQILKNTSNTEYCVIAFSGNVSKSTYNTYDDNFVLSIVEVDNNAALRFNCNKICVTEKTNVNTSDKTFKSSGQHFTSDGSGGSVFLYRAN